VNSSKVRRRQEEEPDGRIAGGAMGVDLLISTTFVGLAIPHASYLRLGKTFVDGLLRLCVCTWYMRLHWSVWSLRVATGNFRLEH
jgi:hypothetical protein